MKRYPARYGCLLTVLGFLTITWIKLSPGDDGGPAGLQDLQTLYKRLMAAEELGMQISRNLSTVLEQMRNITAAAAATSGIVTHPNRSRSAMALSPSELAEGRTGQQTILLPNIYSYMSHLRDHPDSLVTNVVLGHGRRGVSLVLGIPTVKRAKQSYLINTLNSLLYSLTPSQKQDLLIIVFVAENSSDYVSSIRDTITKNFPTEAQSGLLEVVSPSQHFYPDFSTLKTSFGDSMERVRWRTKQNLDFSFLMFYAQDKGTYYVQLEDDVVAKADYYSSIKTYVSKEASTQWLFLEFSSLGFIGKLFRARDLPMIAEFFLMFHRDKPIDWLLDHILWVKVCNPEKDKASCDQQKALMKRRYKPSLFQHVGLYSSLPGKLQHLKDKDFGKQSLHMAHDNPAAVLSSNLTHYQLHSLERLYNGQDFFWAQTPTQGDYILIRFTQPVHAYGYLFRSGNIELSGDKFYNTTVEVLPSNAPAKIKLSSRHKESDNGFIIIGAFENGVAEGQIEEALRPISAIRLVVHTNSDVWALLSEVHIKV